MIPLRTSTISASLSVLCIFGIASPRPVLAEPKSTQIARGLLEDSKKLEFEQKIATKQTELDRLNEDLKKGQRQIEGFESSVQKVTSAFGESTKELEQLMAQKKHSAKELELLSLRIEAEKLKSEGLKMLENANKKSLESWARRNEEIDARSAIVAAEVRQLAGRSPGEDSASGPGTRAPKGDVSISELRKKLAKAERATSSAVSLAQEAMASASSRLHQADVAAAKADKVQEEISLEKNPSFPGGNDPLKP